MANLPTPTPSGFVQIPNRGFEDGATKWITAGSAIIVNESAMTGAWCVKAVGSDPNDGFVSTADIFPVVPGQSITLSVACYMPTGTAGTSVSADFTWYDGDGNFVSTKEGTEVLKKSLGTKKGTATVQAIVPVGVAGVRARSDLNVAANSTIYVDDFSWNYNFPVAISLSSPSTITYENGTAVPFRIQSTLPSGTTVTNVKYYAAKFIGGTYETPELVAELTDTPFAFNEEGRAEGTYGAYAVVTLSNGLKYTTENLKFSVGSVTPPDVREYRASNSGTFLIIENFSKLAESLPSTALVVGAELEVAYDLELLSRTKDKDIAAENSSTDTIFSVIPQGSINATLLLSKDQVYETFGTTLSTVVPINRSDFTLEEDMISEEYRWNTHTLNTSGTAKVGGSSSLFGITSMAAQDFINTSIGLSFLPERGTIPSTAEKGNACVRFKINSVRLKVYFDAGSVEYYFSSPDGSNILKGVLVSSNVSSGDLRNGDAIGIMQLSPELEIMDGGSKTILKDYEVHSHYPPTEENKIADVTEDMSYNGLPSYPKVSNNRSRYQFITANFYGDERLNSIYGVNGVDRAFSYNGKDFYKIHTQPEADKDLPRHIAEHHLHLALGYQEGRVDMSVVGEPYNFSGAAGASSWGIGDGVTGLLKLSGTILGVFGSNSISGLSGTTVDNFAVQTISPKMGALEYTVVDMGYPVYANSYGIYTLSQTQQYGDYLGSPLSQDISPWLRPRLIRKDTSDKEVVISWPVRSKNQYRLAFADGYTLTMTMNNGQQSAPTFSLQKYFIPGELGGPIADFGAELGGESSARWDAESNLEMKLYSAVLIENVEKGRPITVNVISTDAPEDVLSLAKISDSVSGEIFGDLSDVPFTFTLEAGNSFWIESTYEEYEAVISLTYEGMTGGEDKYSYPSIVPAAVSSQLDQGGEERIHITNTQNITADSAEEEEEDCGLLADSSDEWGYNGNNYEFYAYYDPNMEVQHRGMEDSPYWIGDAGFAGQDLLLDFYDDGNWIPYNHDSDNKWVLAEGYDMIYHDKSQGLVKGTIYSWDMKRSVCFYWKIPSAG